MLCLLKNSFPTKIRKNKIASGCVINGATIVLTRLPLSPNPAPVFELMQCRVEGAIADPQEVG